MACVCMHLTRMEKALRTRLEVLLMLPYFDKWQEIQRELHYWKTSDVSLLLVLILTWMERTTTGILKAPLIDHFIWTALKMTMH